MRLQRLLHPHSIAFVGGSECAIAIERTRALGFEGRIWAVNPRRPQLGGVPTIPSITDIDGSPDAAFIALPRALTPEAVAALRALGCGGAVIYAAGFAETGDLDRQRSLLEAAWKVDQGTVTDSDMAMAKLKATEMLAFVADEAIQIHGGMGLMSDLPLERIWRDARVERIWEGTSEIQRHIISRALLRPLGA